MSNEGISPRNRVRAFIWQTWDMLSKPDASVTEPGLALRARLLSVLSLFLFVSSIIGIVYKAITAGPKQAFSESFLGAIILIIVSLLAYVFSRTPFINIGSIVFTAGISLSAYMLAFASQASVSIILYSTLLPALVIAAALLSTSGLVILTITNAILISIIPLYITSYTVAQFGTDAGNLITVGFMLWLLISARNTTERNRLADLQKANAELHALQTSLEQRVDERTTELAMANKASQKRSSELQAITEISQTIALVQNIDDLLPLITGLISERFGFYHVGVFLVDEARETAVLQAANSKGGQRMLARNHYLKLGSSSLVGFASQTGRSRVALDVGTDAIYFDNPDLPDTHSEVALPLKIGERVIGVLDVQSTETAAFKEDELGILTTLSNQVAVAIQNARLYHDTRSVLTDTYKTAGKKNPQMPLSVTGFTYEPDGSIQPAPAIMLDEINSIASKQTVIVDAASGASMPTLHVPVKLRDQTIGILNIQSSDPNRAWSEDEIAIVQVISERAAFALENARLFENATRRAEQEEKVARVTSRIGGSTDFNRILQTTVQELSQALNTNRAYIQLGVMGQEESKQASKD